MSHAPEPIIGTDPPEPPGEAIAQTVEALQRRVLGDLDEVLAASDPAVGAAPYSETPD
ncbi:MAG: hypothetical protein Q7J48_13850 [Nocardioides sp.]|nr:hypothetical protein [Nocardioides sp.]